jgi:hypothetical protein
MDRSDEARAETAVLAKALESIAGKLKTERGLSDEAIGLALLATGLNTLAKAWSGPDLCEHMAHLTGSMMATYGVEPSGEVIPFSRLN